AAHFIQHAIAKNDFSEASFANYNREVFRLFNAEIKAHNFFLKFSTISMWMLNNVWLKSRLFKRFYENKIKSWTNTAYEKKIVVTV
ncbi:MAG: hypothetical protein H7101_11440, partial [Deinococcales bacterium]|nr:hypothetical protein [Chitinophagaceae bacterium]